MRRKSTGEEGRWLLCKVNDVEVPLLEVPHFTSGVFFHKVRRCERCERCAHATRRCGAPPKWRHLSNKQSLTVLTNRRARPWVYAVHCVQGPIDSLPESRARTCSARSGAPAELGQERRRLRGVRRHASLTRQRSVLGPGSCVACSVASTPCMRVVRNDSDSARVGTTTTTTTSSISA